MMNTSLVIRTFAFALVLVMTATGLWATGAEEQPAAAADKKYVTDPSTGEVVVAPQYGGTITFARNNEPAGPDVVISGPWAQAYVAGVLEKLARGDWALDREEFDFKSHYTPLSALTGQLAESWSQPDPLTYVVKVRQGVHWHDKPPMNGRELTADDVVYNFHRITGTGSGFTEPSEWATDWKGLQVESIEATDQWTVVVKLKELNLAALAAIIDEGRVGWIYPPEVIKEHGGVTDWRNLVGTGPLMLTDWTEGSSITWDKNPDYWGTDEKYPQNRLPYIDRLRTLVMPEPATYLAALRTGRVDYIGPIGATTMKTLDQVESLQRTNPEIVVDPLIARSNNGFGMNVQLPPFDDIRVRKALQMAINLDEIGNAYYKGYADMTPQGSANRAFTCCVTQFEEWPEDVKRVFDYDPEGADALLDEAGYKRGADGIRFKTGLAHNESYDLNYVQLVASYWDQIGIDVEIDVYAGAQHGALVRARDYEMISAEAAGRAVGPPLSWWHYRYTPGSFDKSNVNDPWYSAKVEAARNATTLEEYYSMVKELDQYAVEQFWQVWGGAAPQYVAFQPWVKGFNGEMAVGRGQYNTVFTRLWVDSELKEEMGH